MKMLRSIEIHDWPNGLARVTAVYTVSGESQYHHEESKLIREPFADLPVPVSYSTAVEFAERKGQHMGRAVVDYVLMNAKIPLVESLALMKNEELS